MPINAMPYLHFSIRKLPKRQCFIVKFKNYIVSSISRDKKLSKSISKSASISTFMSYLYVFQWSHPQAYWYRIQRLRCLDAITKVKNYIINIHTHKKDCNKWI